MLLNKHPSPVVSKFQLNYLQIVAQIRFLVIIHRNGNEKL